MASFSPAGLPDSFTRHRNISINSNQWSALPSYASSSVLTADFPVLLWIFWWGESACVLFYPSIWSHRLWVCFPWSSFRPWFYVSPVHSISFNPGFHPLVSFTVLLWFDRRCDWRLVFCFSWSCLRKFGFCIIFSFLQIIYLFLGPFN